MYWPLLLINQLIIQVNKLDSITCNKRDSINESPTKLNVVENKFDTSDLFTNGENHWGKTPPGEFKVTTPKNPLLSKQAFTSKRNPSTNLQLNPYSNTQLDL